jgi:hypothetical protein
MPQGKTMKKSSMGTATKKANGDRKTVARPKTTAKAKTNAAAAAAPVVGSETEYDQWLPAARAVAKGDIVPLRGDVALAYPNAARAAAALVAERTRIANELPAIDVAAIGALPGLALATMYASSLVRAGSDGALRAKLAEGHKLRARMLSAARALADAGVLAEKAVADIEHGHGSIDTAQDLIALAALFKKNATKIAGKHPVSDADVVKAATFGTELLTVLRPKRAKHEKPRDVTAATDTRDRMWTLLTQRWDTAWRAGAYLFGPDEAHARVPSLQSHAKNVKHKTKPSAPPSPAPAASKG